MEPQPSFQAIVNKILSHYGDTLTVDDSAHFVADVIEVWEDIARFKPVIDGLVACSLSEDELAKGLLTLRALSWHTAAHLESIHQNFEAAD